MQLKYLGLALHAALGLGSRPFVIAVVLSAGAIILFVWRPPIIASQWRMIVLCLRQAGSANASL